MYALKGRWKLEGDNALLAPFIDPASSQQTHALQKLCDAAREFSVRTGRRPVILDLGCGAGGSYEEFQTLGLDFEWIGLDIEDSPEARERTRQDLRFITYDGLSIPLPDNQVDIVYSHQVFEHVRNPPRVLQEVRRVLRDEGYFVGSTSHLEPFHSRSLWNFTPYGFAMLATDCGFQNVLVYPGIDSLTLIARRLLAYMRINLGHYFFRHQSPLNFVLECFGKPLPRNRRTLLKLLFCGQFAFVIR